MGCFWLKNEKNQLKFFIAARSTFYLLNLAREQKSLATPDIQYKHVKNATQLNNAESHS